MGNKSKKQKISYKNDVSSKAEELEKDLFGSLADPENLFAPKDTKEILSIKNYSDKNAVKASDDDLFFIDKGGDSDGEDNDLSPPVIESFQNDSSDEDEDSEEGDEEEKAAVKDGEDEKEGNSLSSSSDEEEEGGEEEGEEEESDKVTIKKNPFKDAVLLKETKKEIQQNGAKSKSKPKPKSGPAWEDPDDKTLRVDVVNNSRLRKLRKNDKQRQMSGAEFESALRRQHQSMNPRTSWASEALNEARAAAAAADAVLGSRLSSKRAWTEEDDGSDDEDGGREKDSSTTAAAATAATFLRRAGGVLAGRNDNDSDDEDEDEEGEGLFDEDGDPLSSSSHQRSRRTLAPTILETSRLRDANEAQPSSSVLRSVQFLPGGSGQLLLTAGLDRRLRLFGVDGVSNPLIQSVFIEDMPIWQASFISASPSSLFKTTGSSNGNGNGNGAITTAAAATAANNTPTPHPAQKGSSVLLTGRRPFFYLYDLEAARIERVLAPKNVPAPLKSLERFAAMGPGACRMTNEPLVAFYGDQGYVPLVSLRSRQAVASVKLPGAAVGAAAFAEDGIELWTSGKDDGLVSVWDIRMSRHCRFQFRDQGNAGGGGAASLAVSPDSRFIATGSRSGIVNVYRRQELDAAVAAAAYSGPISHNLAPAKELTNLVTAVDAMKFSEDSQMLVFSSRLTRDALRVAHLPSMTVFANWPTSKTPMGHVQCADVTSEGGMIVM
eukprot:CAMPEP_0175049890 /NCGR_PEP_ID=MMETSP0052_2-20121109/6967_1 /TAXON_ID=51329 ORGANISM="Polytomella parva, Strain SAG 63-3" /NCGR_SAMPLE_ID=MMETSP0052_2 /ASSEMBLY_ACC=CAM_ASM_000194 /LENGTH=719 /DNA_ID=CAMNT_0016314057 /DNA_START=19 /DNA_END=2175 /DNA_ORIENTATION=+